MYLNPQDKRDNFTEFAFLAGVVCQAKATTATQDRGCVTHILDLDKTNSFSMEFTVSCFNRLVQLGYRYPDRRIPGGVIEWINNGVLCTLSWFPLNEESNIRVLYSEDSESESESAKFFHV